jgi:hypothetical protein
VLRNWRTLGRSKRPWLPAADLNARWDPRRGNHGHMHRPACAYCTAQLMPVHARVRPDNTSPTKHMPSLKTITSCCQAASSAISSAATPHTCAAQHHHVNVVVIACRSFLQSPTTQLWFTTTEQLQCSTTAVVLLDGTVWSDPTNRCTAAGLNSNCH